MKVTKEQHEEIRKLFAEGHTRKEIAAMYGVSASHISHIVNFEGGEFRMRKDFPEEWNRIRKRVLKGLRKRCT